MPGERLELLDELYGAWGVGTPQSEVLPYLHDEFEWVNPDYAVEPGTRRGPEGWLAAMVSADEAFESMEHEVHERIEAGDRVLCLLTFRALTRGAGIPYEVPEQHLWSFRDGRIARLQWFHDEAEAREAAGLPPRGDLVLVAGPELAIARAHEADLRGAFEDERRFLFRSVDSCDAALTLLNDLHEHGGRCALLDADDDTREIGGLELVARARAQHPDLKAIALVAHANYAAALRSLNAGHLDRQLVKPIEASGNQLVAEARDLLDDWLRRRDYAERAVRLIGDPETEEAWRLRDFLSRNDIHYLLLEPESPDGRELLRNWAEAELPQPIVVLEDGRRLGNPTLRELTEALRMPTEPKRSEYDLVIVGGGPAGLAGAVYAASEGLRTCLIEREAPGGQAGQSSRIENYLGFPAGLTGTDLAQRALAQSKRFGAEIVRLKVAGGLRSDGDARVLHLADGGELRSRAMLVSCGVSYRRLEADGIEALTGRGVFYGVSPGEAERYAGRRVAIVGGANSAAQAALKFAESAEQVTLLIRGDSLEGGASQYLCSR
ncbi:MAG: FAD-dependent oxidoreductase, partial [Solirubrobacterales bacterium]